MPDLAGLQSFPACRCLGTVEKEASGVEASLTLNPKPQNPQTLNPKPQALSPKP